MDDFARWKILAVANPRWREEGKRDAIKQL
jgi:hypothetical protein